MTVIDVNWTSRLRPNDLVVVAQGVGEPTPLLAQLLAEAPPGVEVFVGLSHSDALTRPTMASLVSFGAMGPLAAAARRGGVEIIPAHFDDLPRVLPHRGRDLVVLVQVGEADRRGEHNLGVAVDYTYELAPVARLVVAEVNAQLPATSAPASAARRIDVAVPTSRPLPVVEEPEVGEVHRRIAAHIASLVFDGATLQLGVGAVAGAVARALTGHHDLRVRSTLTGDWLLTLAESGALHDAADAVVISEAAGSAELYKYVAASDVSVRPVSEVIRVAAAGGVESLVAVNSAVQVDLTGQVNAERIPSGYIGGIGGHTEYLRAAQRSPGGLAIVALPATAGRHSRLVTCLNDAPVTTPRSYVDIVVTEFGIADLRGRGLRERAALITRIAAPEHRAGLGARASTETSVEP